MGKLEGKIAMVTGGNSGIGLAAARLFVAEGAHVAITGRNQKTLRGAAAELGNRVLAIQADVTNVEATERAVATAVEKFGTLISCSRTLVSVALRPWARHLKPLSTRSSERT